ncbi:ABC transporter C family member 9 [Corchorus olitorius]|uniref:ABC transporter C family member 9 n=1 Tax=Corchorus olitorius TaxID=93759 RepID=A0A1R3GI55_9ROSI|nr:ABC transporter C family member 9 [Corchorus olitorius]
MAMKKKIVEALTYFARSRFTKKAPVKEFRRWSNGDGGERGEAVSGGLKRKIGVRFRE